MAGDQSDSLSWDDRHIQMIKENFISEMLGEVTDGEVRHNLEQGE